MARLCALSNCERITTDRFHQFRVSCSLWMHVEVHSRTAAEPAAEQADTRAMPRHTIGMS